MTTQLRDEPGAYCLGGHGRCYPRSPDVAELNRYLIADELAQNPTPSNREIARRLGVSKTTVAAVKTRGAWNRRVPLRATKIRTAAVALEGLLAAADAEGQARFLAGVRAEPGGRESAARLGAALARFRK